MAVRVGEERFSELVREALSELPPDFAKYLRGLEIQVEDYPDDEIMLELGLKPPNYPFGLYEGPSILETDNPRDFPGRIVLFRRPLEEWCQTEEELRDQIRRTVFHELAHRFGFSDEEMFDELRAGAGLPWKEEERREEADRYLKQAEHDLRAAELLAERGFFDWALEIALTSAWRSLFAFLVKTGEDPEAIAEEDIPRLWARAVRRDPRFLSLRELPRLDRITVEMGEPGLPPPRERVGERQAKAVLGAAKKIFELARGEEDGKV